MRSLILFNPKNNGLGAIRLYLALSVTIHHIIVVGHFSQSDYLLGSYLGGLAVDSFFALSGFLIARSYYTNSDLIKFFAARILRIYPGFWVCLLISCLVIYPIGVYLLTNSLDAVFFFQMKDYFLSNFTLQIKDQQLVWLVNGSFWTLGYEFICYLMIGFLGLFRLLKPIYLLAIFGFYWSVFIANAPRLPLEDIWFSPSRLFPYFLAGAICYLWRDRLFWSWKWWTGITALILISYSFISLHFLSMPILIYFLLGLAKIFPKNIEQEQGDYSYGIYLYHYPICELLARLKITQFYIYLPIVLLLSCCLAFLSWHYIEKPSLKLKNLSINTISFHHKFQIRSYLKNWSQKES